MNKLAAVPLVFFGMSAFPCWGDYLTPQKTQEIIPFIQNELEKGKNVVVLFTGDSGPDGENEWHADFYSFMNDYGSGNETVFIDMKISEAEVIFKNAHIPKSDVSGFFFKSGKKALYHAEPITQETFDYAKAYFQGKAQQTKPEDLGFRVYDFKIVKNDLFIH